MAKKVKKPISYIGHFVSNQKGFGFVEVEGLDNDIFVGARDTGNAFHQDIVEVEIIKQASKDKRSEGRITRVIEHEIKQVVGTFDRAAGFGFVIPDNQKIESDIFVSKENSKKAVSGHKVICRITDYGDRDHKPEGEIIQILGHANDPGVDILSIVKAYELPEEFSERVLRQAERVAGDVTEADMAGRLDLRSLQMVTIDGEDSKDLDDAVSLYQEDGLYHLGVHIADVANYVQEGSALDREALERGTSVYLVDRVIPMLPHVLSNGICSLNQGEDRLALSCLMTIDADGEVIDHTIAETVINVNKRMNYSDVNRILRADELLRAGGKEADKVKQLLEFYQDEKDMFVLMAKLSGIIRQNRARKGSIDFDIPESKIILNKRGIPVDIRPFERAAAEKLIEDFMLLANETVAEHFYWLELPFVYRVHATPDPDKILKLGTFINNFGYSIKVKGSEEGIHPKELQKLLLRIEGTPEEALISRLTLRSMRRAEYNTDCLGHFGLAFKYYTHFTSPIRRYPDLQIHRIIKEYLRGRLKDGRIAHYEGILPQVAKQSSTLERRAEEAERETDRLKKVQYMSSRIGEEYEGVISGVTAWGIYVELPNTVEGMVHVSNLEGDFYYYREESYEMVGRDHGKTYGLGQRVKVRVFDVDMSSRTIDFRII